jgi:ferredoxin-NADP reductase
MPYTFYDAEVLEIIEETESLRRYIVCVNELERFEFRAGQFVMLDLPINTRVTTRSYSIASEPAQSNTFELLIVLKPGGAGTEYIFSQVGKGSILRVSQAIGKFFLPEVLEEEICFICTGTGVAPFRSMIRDIIRREQQHKGVSLIFGTRYMDDILYKDEWPLYESRLGEFRFIPVLSREASAEWKGAKGYVHPVYEDLFKDRRPACFYICGWHEMLNEARQRLAAMGYDRSRIRFEAYD